MGRPKLPCAVCGQIDNVEHCAKCRQKEKQRAHQRAWRLRNPEKYKEWLRNANRQQAKRRKSTTKNNQTAKESIRPKRTTYTTKHLQGLSTEKFLKAFTEDRIV